MKFYWRNLLSFRIFWVSLFIPICAAVALSYFLHAPGWVVGVVFWVLFAAFLLGAMGTQAYCNYCRARVSVSGQLVCKKCGRATDKGKAMGITP